jgi:hypothetical protein
MSEAQRVCMLLVTAKLSKHCKFIERIEVVALDRGRAQVITESCMGDGDFLPLERRQVF